MTVPSSSRIVVQFSCGAASAVAAKLVLGEYGLSHEVHLINAFLKEEHPDNRRFLADCERWLNHPITVLRDEKYGASVREVFRRKRYLKGLHGAPCRRALKGDVLDAYKRPDDTLVLGYTAEEEDRLDDFLAANPLARTLNPLIDRGLTKADCLALVERAGIELPITYRMGYHNANCIGCVKGGAGYWNKIRRDFPADFEEMAQIEESIGPGARLLRHRSGPLKGQRFYLRELHPDAGRHEEINIECGAACEWAENSAAWDELRALPVDAKVDLLRQIAEEEGISLDDLAS